MLEALDLTKIYFSIVFLDSILELESNVSIIEPNIAINNTIATIITKNQK